jgi:hypothetical protein
MLSDFTRGLAVTLGGDLAAGRVLLRDVTEQISWPPLRDDPRSLLFLALTSGFLGDPRIAMAVGSYQLSQVRNRGALGVLVPALALFASGRAWLGDHARAFADAGEASELGNQLGYAADTAVAVEMLAWQSAARGFHQDAHAALERAKSLTDRAGTTGFAAHQALTAAFCALCRTDPAAAVSLLEARIAADGGVGSMGEPLGVAPYLVEAYVAVGRRDEALAVAEQFAAVTSPAAPPWLRALVARCRGLTAADDETTVEAYEAALVAHADAPDTFETARTHLLYGARLRRSRSTRQGEGTAAHRSRRLRGDGPRGLGASRRRRACRHRGQAAYPPTPADGAAHLPGDADSPACGKGHVQQGDRRSPVPQPEDGRASSQQRLPEAGFSAPARSSPDHSVRARTADPRRYTKHPADEHRCRKAGGGASKGRRAARQQWLARTHSH